MKIVFQILLTLCFLCCCRKSSIEPLLENIDCKNVMKPFSHLELKTGDIIFQTTATDRSKAIQLATHSKYTHIGIIILIEGEVFVLHAGSTVSFKNLNKWIEDGVGHYFKIKRLSSYPDGFDNNQEKKFLEVIQKYKGLPYDYYFEISDESIYCSELVWKIYKDFLEIEIGKMRKLKDYDIQHEEVRQKIKSDFSGRVSHDELMISPGDIFESDLLFEIEFNMETK